MKEFAKTTSGEVLKLRHVPSRLVFEIAVKHKIPGPPTYTVEIAGGDTREFEHDETTLETTADRQAWARYEQEKALAEFEQQQEINQFLIDVCIANEPPPLEEWSIDYKRWGLTAPDAEDKASFKRRWIEEEVCPDPEDFLNLLVELYKCSGIQEDRIRAIQSFFQLALERAATRGLED